MYCTLTLIVVFNLQTLYKICSELDDHKVDKDFVLVALDEVNCITWQY